MRLLAALLALALPLGACTSAPVASPTTTATAPLPAQTPTGAPAATAGPSPSPVGYDRSGWSASAIEFREREGETFTFECPAGGQAVVAWGTDLYTTDSSVCTAATHAGLITLAAGGVVTIEIRPGATTYAGTTRNGVTTIDYGTYTSSFAFPAAGQPSPSASMSAVEALRQHVPVAYRASCEETSVSMAEPGALVALVCSRQASGPGAEIIEYVQFDSVGNMQAAYQQRVANFGEQSTGGSCQVEASELSYTIDGAPAGRLMCAEQIGGIRLDWTDERLNILSYMADFDADYAALYQSWLEAGPDE